MSKKCLKESSLVKLSKIKRVKMTPLIQIRDLDINVDGKHILKNINLDINEGDSIGIIGKSGAGKSTLLHLLRGFEEFEDITGEVIFNISYCPKCGKINPPSSAGSICPKCRIKTEMQRADYLNSKAMHRKIMERTAIMMQRTFGLYGDETVLENIMHSFEHSDIPKEKRPYMAAELIEEVKLSHRMMYTGKELSGGEKQRVVLARQLAKHPMLLLADEPTGTLDPKTAKLVHDSILKAKKEHNITLLVTSHLPDVIEDLTNQAILLEEGELVTAGKPAEIIARFLATTGEVRKRAIAIGEQIIRVSDVKKKYYSYSRGLIPAVNGVSFDVHEGEIFGIIGISGAGKTTLSKVIAGIMDLDDGRVDVRIGDAWVNMDEKGSEFRGRAKPHIGYLHQEYSLYPYRTVLQNLTESIGLRLDPELARMKAAKVLKAVGFCEDAANEILGKTQYELSVGERQRVTMAQVLMREPRIIIFDEPTGTMDPVTKNEVANSILTARQETGTTFVIVSHDMEFVSQVCDRVALMRLGKMVAIGDVEAVIAKVGEEDKVNPQKLLEYALMEAERSSAMNRIKDMDFYVELAKENGSKLGIDISDDLKKFTSTYEKGIEEALKKAEEYLEEKQVYEMDLYLELAIKYASKLGKILNISNFKRIYADGIEEALKQAEKYGSKGHTGYMYILIKRVGRYAPKLGRSLEEILKETPWYQRWALTNVYSGFSGKA